MLIRRGKYWHYTFQINGRRYRGSTEETVRARAAQVEAHKIAKVREGGADAIVTGRAPILSEWAATVLKYYEELVAAGHRDADTDRYYRNGWRLLSVTKIASYRLDRITAKDAHVLIFPGGPSNANCALRTLRRLLHAAVEERRLVKAPEISIVEEKGREQLIEPWMEDLLLRHAVQPLHDILIHMYDAGCRPEEVMRARRSHLLWERERVRVSKHKTSADVGTRYVPFTERMQQMYLDHKNKEDDWLYPSKRAASGHRVTIAKQWKACVEAVNAERATQNLAPLPEELVPYCARHTFATDLLNDSKNLRLVQKVLGHTDIKTTMRYLHPEDEQAVDVMNARNRRRAMHVVEKTG